MQNNIILECVETGERLYLTSKNQRNTPYRLELKNIRKTTAKSNFS